LREVQRSKIQDQRSKLKDFLEVAVRAGDDVNADEFANALRGGAAGVGGGFHGAYVTGNHYGDETAADALLAQQLHVGSLYHCVGCFYSADQTFCFNQA
jgi:hypothetical protein